MTDTNSGGAMQVDPALVRQLAELLDETSLTEIEVQDGDRRIRVARKAAQVAAATYAPAPAPAAPQVAPAASSAPTPPAVDPVDDPGTVKSPMVGTVYLSAEPGGKPFVAPGQKVAAGDTLLIVEAMKVMNPILSPRAGTVTRLIVQNGQPVEFDQPLAIVE